MSLDSYFYRTGPNYKLNQDQLSDDFEEQFRDLIESYTPLFEAHFHRFYELSDKIKSMVKYEEDDYEFELSRENVEELILWVMKESHSEYNGALLLTCRAALQALREGYKIVFLESR